MSAETDIELDRVTTLRRAYEQALDELGVKEELVRSLRKREASYLEALEQQSVLIIELEEYIHGKDIVRTGEIRRVIEQLWERTRS